jgi:hypothetical protein
MIAGVTSILYQGDTIELTMEDRKGFLHEDAYIPMNSWRAMDAMDARTASAASTASNLPLGAFAHKCKPAKTHVITEGKIN